MNRFLLAFCLLLSGFFNRVNAWGSQGHKIIALIAKSQVSKEVVQMVDSYLNGMSWEDVACWMEEPKPGGCPAYMKDWHFINLPRDKTYVKTKLPNLINQIEYYLKLLKNRSMYSSETVFEAIKIIFHLVGDMAQPLHCGYVNDKGGANTALTFIDRPSTLHNVWDSDIIAEEKIDIWTCSQVMLSLTSHDKRELQLYDLQYWLNDSRACLKDVYDFKDGVIDKAYSEKNKELIQIQLVKAGLRLAAILQANFK